MPGIPNKTNDDASPLLDEPAPCDNCIQRSRCERQRLACAAFSGFVNGGSAAQWSRLPRQVSRRQFERIFGTPEILRGAGPRISSLRSIVLQRWLATPPASQSGTPMSSPLRANRLKAADIFERFRKPAAGQSHK